LRRTSGGNDSKSYLKELLTDHESITEFLKGKINVFADKFQDAGTSDYITGLMQNHEEMAWMLRAHTGVSFRS
jgi:starvation-inducible DNA-binding protein